MARTRPSVVQAILGTNWDGTTDLSPFIEKASLQVDRAVTCASDEDITLSDAEEEMMERWLAAYYYTIADPMYTSRSTLGASGSFATDSQGKSYLNSAFDSDPSGCLDAVVNKKFAKADWLGKTESEAISYEDRQ